MLILIVTLLSGFHHVIILTLITVGFMLAYNPQFIRKVIITVPVTVTFSLMLPSDLHPVFRAAVIVAYTAVIIGLILRFHNLHFLIKILFIILKYVVFIIRRTTISIAIPFVKKTGVVVVTATPIVISSSVFFNFSATTAIGTLVIAVVLTFSCNYIRNEVFCALLLTETFSAIKLTLNRLDDQNFLMAMTAFAILLISLCLSIDLQKTFYAFFTMNIIIFIIDLVLSSNPPHFITHDQLLLIYIFIPILSLAWYYELIGCILFIALIVFVIYAIYYMQNTRFTYFY